MALKEIIDYSIEARNIFLLAYVFSFTGSLITMMRSSKIILSITLGFVSFVNMLLRPNLITAMDEEIARIIVFTSPSSTLWLAGSDASLNLDTSLTNISGTLLIDQKNVNSVQQTAIGNTLQFNNGVLQSGNAKLTIQGSLDPTTGDVILLQGNQSLSVERGTILEAINVSGSNNSLIGAALLSSPIVLQDALTGLNLAWQVPLNQPIVLNGGTINLQTGLDLSDGGRLQGNGTVGGNGCSLILPFIPASQAWSNTLTLNDVAEITLTGCAFLSGVWNLTGNGTTTVIDGHGNMLDLTAGGILNIGPGHTVKFVNIHLNGVGSTGGNLVLQAANSKVIFSDATLDLSGTYTQTNGTIIVQETDCILIARNSDTVIVDGLNTVFQVSNVVLFYDSLTTTATYISVIAVQNGGTLSIINGGSLRNRSVQSGPFGLTKFTNLNNILTFSYNLGPNEKLSFLNTAAPLAQAMALDGSGCTIQMNKDESSYWTVEPNITLTLSNLLLQSFDPDLWDLQGTGINQAQIVFGDNNLITLDKNLTVTKALNFVAGLSVIDGQHHTLTLAGSSMLALQNGANLTIKNATLVLSNADSLHCALSSSTLTLQNVDVYFAHSDFTFDVGNLQIDRQVRMFGCSATVTGQANAFNFTSSGQATILSGGKWIINPVTKLTYNPDVSLDVGNSLLEMRHITFADPSSCLQFLNGSQIMIGSMGWAWDYGLILLDGYVLCTTATAPNPGLFIGSAAQVEIGAAANFDVEGILTINQTSYP